MSGGIKYTRERGLHVLWKEHGVRNRNKLGSRSECRQLSRNYSKAAFILKSLSGAQNNLLYYK